MPALRLQRVDSPLITAPSLPATSEVPHGRLPFHPQQENTVNQPDRSTNVSDMFGELDAGVFEQKLARSLSEVALGVVTTGKKGKVVVTFDMAQIANSSQVNLQHSLKYIKPTGNGKVTEENTTATPLHVGVGGKLTLFPDTQEKLFKEPARE